MDRKWRTNIPAVHSLQPYFSFVRSTVPALPPGAPPPLASPSDLYSVYTVLHIEKKRNELFYDSEGHFYYFVASFEESVGASAAVDAGEEESGDEGAGEGGEEVGEEGAGEEGEEVGEEGAGEEGEEVGEEEGEDEGERGEDEEKGGEDREADGESSVEAASADGGEASAPAPPASLPKGWRTRTQIVVPVSSASNRLTPRALSRVFGVRGVDAQQLLLAMVDGHGVVSRTSMYNYIQAPLEGAGMADLVLREGKDKRNARGEG